MARRIAFKHANDNEEQMSAPAGTDSMNPADTWIRIFDVARLLIQRRRLIVTFTMGAALATAFVLFLIPDRFESHATILPSGQGDKFSELKSLTGLGMTASSENSSELFPSIIKSHLVKNALMDREFAFEQDGESRTITLSEYFDEDNPDKLRKRVDEITSVHKDKKTGVITIGVETEYAGFSQKVLNTYLAELENFNLYKRRSRGKENAAYLSKQVDKKERELELAEKQLENFRSLNRNWATSSNPEILSNLSRLERNVQVNATAFLYLTREHEAAKLDAQKDVPIVRILDSPSLPTIKSGPKRLIGIAVASVMAFLTILLIVVAIEAVKRQKEGTELDSYIACREDFSKAFPRMSRLMSGPKKPQSV